MKLTYRGVNYESQTIDKQLPQFPIPIPVDQCGANKIKHLDRLISIKPVYYTYRGVSYIKNYVSNTKPIVLLELDRQ